MKRKIFALLLCLFVLGFASCGKENITLDEVREVLPDLVKNSVVLNQIYFGEGFLPSADAGASPVGGYYYADSMRLGFAAIEEIKDATEQVFTPAYAALLYESAFDGISTGETVVAPRYIEGEMGILQSMGGTVYDLPTRVYHFDTLAIVEKGTERVTVSVETAANGETVTVELIVVRTGSEDGYVYRLDSPTY